jgi:hypothetical protein
MRCCTTERSSFLRVLLELNCFVALRDGTENQEQGSGSRHSAAKRFWFNDFGFLGQRA